MKKRRGKKPYEKATYGKKCLLLGFCMVYAAYFLDD